jgi:hypothetical protein
MFIHWTFKSHVSTREAHECNLIRQKGESRGGKKQQLRADSSKYLKVFHEKENLNLEKNMSCNMEVRNVQENLGINVSLMFRKQRLKIYKSFSYSIIENEKKLLLQMVAKSMQLNTSRSQS